MCVCVGFSWPAEREVHAGDHMACVQYVLYITLTIPFLGGPKADTCMTQDGYEQSLASQAKPTILHLCIRLLGVPERWVRIALLSVWGPGSLSTGVQYSAGWMSYTNCKDQGCHVL